MKPKVIRRGKIIKIRSQLIETENKNTTEQINGRKNWLFEKIHKINKSLARLTKKKKRKDLNK